MLFKDIWSIDSKIEEAKRLNNSILFFSEEAYTMHRSSQLSDVISNLQARSTLIRSECIRLLKKNIDLEKRLKEVDQGIQRKDT